MVIRGAAVAGRYQDGGFGEHNGIIIEPLVFGILLISFLLDFSSRASNDGFVCPG